MDLAGIQQHAHAFLEIPKAPLHFGGVEIRVGKYDGKQYDVPHIMHTVTEERSATQARGPDYFLDAMRGYAKKVVAWQSAQNVGFPQFFHDTKGNFNCGPWGTLPSELSNISYMGKDYSRRYLQEGFPVLLELAEQCVKDREALITRIFEENKTYLSDTKNISFELQTLIDNTFAWRETILPALKQDVFVRDHVQMEAAMTAEIEERAKPRTSVGHVTDNEVLAALKAGVVIQ